MCEKQKKNVIGYTEGSSSVCLSVCLLSVNLTVRSKPLKNYGNFRIMLMWLDLNLKKVEFFIALFDDDSCFCCCYCRDALSWAALRLQNKSHHSSPADIILRWNWLHVVFLNVDLDLLLNKTQNLNLKLETRNVLICFCQMIFNIKARKRLSLSIWK